MSDNLAEAFNNLKKMVDSGNIPSEVQGLVNNLNNGNGDSKQTLNNMLSQVSPEMLNNLSSMLQSNNSSGGSNYNSGASAGSNYNSNSSNSFNQNFRPSNGSNYSSNNNSNNNFNLDPETLMKMTSVISAMNQKDNPGNNLLHSLKPYLRDSRKDKLDQYANLLNLSKIAEVMKNEKKENNNHG